MLSVRFTTKSARSGSIRRAREPECKVEEDAMAHASITTLLLLDGKEPVHGRLRVLPAIVIFFTLTLSTYFI
jgi:hypothetical protein